MSIRSDHEQQCLNKYVGWTNVYKVKNMSYQEGSITWSQLQEIEKKTSEAKQAWLKSSLSSIELADINKAVSNNVSVRSAKELACLEHLLECNFNYKTILIQRNTGIGSITSTDIQSLENKFTDSRDAFVDAAMKQRGSESFDKVQMDRQESVDPVSPRWNEFNPKSTSCPEFPHAWKPGCCSSSSSSSVADTVTISRALWDEVKKDVKETKDILIYVQKRVNELEEQQQKVSQASSTKHIF